MSNKSLAEQIKEADKKIKFYAKAKDSIMVDQYTLLKEELQEQLDNIEYKDVFDDYSY
jgi:hypothetical protein